MNARKIHILLVEDNPGDARLTLEAFADTRPPRRLSHVTNGVQAIDFLRRAGAHTQATLPDLILLDLNLPCKDGREVLAEIKADATLRRIPVVILTTSQAEADILRAYDLNANCYVTKPADLDQFTRVIRCIDEFWLTVAKLPAE
ncbi:MAG TPA: response regulator [Candidatus Binatia bacterium]|nr:response regulator [Candidatus Binatia bacterium]